MGVLDGIKYLAKIAYTRNVWLLMMVVVAYVVFCHISVMLGEPPVISSPVWFPAGVGLSAVLCGGRKYIVSIALGAFAYVSLHENLAWQSHQTNHSAAFIIGAIFQALFAYWVTNRICGRDLRLVRGTEILRFLFVTGIIVPIASVTFQFLLSLSLKGNQLTSDLEFWLARFCAESLGCCLLTPIALAFFGEPREIWRPRRLRIAMPHIFSICTALLIFSGLNHRERLRLETSISAATEEYAKAIDQTSRDGRRCVVALNSLILDGMAPHELALSASGFVKSFDVVRSLGYHPFIRHSERNQFEKSGIVIMRPDHDGHLEPEVQSEWYIPVSLWMDSSASLAPGLNLAYSPSTKRVVESVIIRNRTLAISGREAMLPQLESTNLLVFQPVYQKGEKPTSHPDRRKSVTGVVTCVYDTGIILEKAKSASNNFAGFEVSFVVADGLIGQRPRRQANVSWDFKGALVGVPAYIEEKPIELSIRVGRLDPLVISSNYMLYFLLFGLCILVFFSFGLLVTTGETSVISEEVQKQTMFLKEGETRLRLAICAANLGVWEWDLVRDKISWPTECAIIYGLTSHVMGRDEFIKILHPADIALAEAAFRKAIDDGQSFAVEFRVIRPDGQIRWMSNFAQPEYSADERPLKVVGAVADITERKRIELELQESEGWLRLALQSADLGLWDWDLRTNNAKFSPEWKRQLGYQDSELNSGYLEWESRVHPEDLPLTLDLVRRALESGDRYEAEFRMKHKDGTWRWILARANILRGPNGTAERLIGCHVEVSTRKHAELLLAESERFARETLDALPYNTCVLDETGMIVQVNAGWTAFSLANGGDPALMSEGVNYLDACRSVITNKSENNVVDALEAILTSGREGYSNEYPCFSPTEQRWYRMRATRFMIGNRLRVLVQHEDVTDRRRAQNEIVRLNAQLEQRVAERTKELEEAQLILQKESEERRLLESRLSDALRLESMSVMAGSIAHELNQPLTAISNFARGCVRRLDAGDVGEEVRAVMARTAEEAVRAGTLIRRLRDLTTRHPPSFASGSVNEVVRQSLFILNPILQASGTTIITKLANDLPLIPLDCLLITQVILNLLQNANDAMDECDRSAREITVVTGHDLERECIVVSVQDRGHGLSAEYGDEWFIPFSTSKPTGMGIGLQVVKNIVELHGGKVVASPRSGGGATFTFSLPYLAVEYAPDKTSCLRCG
jgi:PAS domain S-box-containing protein